MPRKHFVAFAAWLFAVCAILPSGTSAAPSAQPNPALDGWSTPVNISQSDQYDNAPGIAAGPNGAITVAWERRPLGRGANHILQASSPSPGGPFTQEQLSETSTLKSSGSARVVADASGRRHVSWWQQEGDVICDFYARVEPNGRTSINEPVPGSCGMGLKNTAMATGPGNTVHMVFGKNLSNIFYWQRTDSGWTTRAEPIPNVRTPRHLAIGVTTGGIVMAAWRDSDGGDDRIFIATRQGPNNWTVENATSELERNCSVPTMSYYPVLVPDPQGGMRMSWSDHNCDPRAPEVLRRDIYYREWTPGASWNSLPAVKLGRVEGESYQNVMTVDGAGVAHVVWVDNTVSVYYAGGRGSSFSEPVEPFGSWDKGAQTKDVAISSSPGYVHLAFTSMRDDPNKETYYSYLQVDTPPVPPAPSPQPPSPPASPSAAIPGDGSRTFHETGKSVIGLFLQYWDARGGVPQQGFPITGLLAEKSELDGNPYVMQYFERAVFEYHPENRPPYNVLLSQLGTLRYRQKYPNGAPNQRPNTSAGSVLFRETGTRVGGRFLQYWQQNGGLMQQGFPISDEFVETSDTNGKPYTVQYFERAVFEYHPENRPPYDVLLSLLGTFSHKSRHGGQ